MLLIKPNFTFIDLFAGIGGFRLALNNLGGVCTQFSEINNDAIVTYCKNFSEDPELNLGDITKIKNLPPHDILTAGVPCQSWSIAGKNLGFDDDRGQLWNDTIYLLNQARPKSFIFENVKGLADPRNKSALAYILTRIQQAGYFAQSFVLNAADYGVPQDRVRVYIIGFLKECYLKKFQLPLPKKNATCLADFLRESIEYPNQKINKKNEQIDLFSDLLKPKTGYRQNHTINNFFLFNDIRNGPTTIHSWDLIDTTERQKHICLLMLRNRRKRLYGALDGNPLSLENLKSLDSSIQDAEIELLVEKEILKRVNYQFTIASKPDCSLSFEERLVINQSKNNIITLDSLKKCRNLKKIKKPLELVLSDLLKKGVLICTEVRYEFRYTKISTGINGINRIFLPTSDAFPTLVASDSNDYIAMKSISANSEEDYKKIFLQEIFQPKLFRKISKEEACLIQGFPENFQLPESRSRWMKLIGNSVSVPVIQILGEAIINTGCLEAHSQSSKAA